MDRRKRKTLQAIQNACFDLLQHKSFEELTISDISEKADISRGTFYLHYVDKFDMLDQFEQQLVDKIKQIFEIHLKDVHSPMDLIKTRYPTLIQLFTCLKEEQALFQIIQQTKGALSFQTELTKVLQNVFHQSPSRQIIGEVKYIPPHFFIPILVSVITGATQQWIAQTEDYTPEQLAKGILNILINGPARAAGWLPGLIDIDEFLEGK